MNTLNDQLKKWKNKNQQDPARKKKAPQTLQKSHSEKLSVRDIKELMGMNRQTLKRHKGSYRQR
jgi:hypothetical protein